MAVFDMQDEDNGLERLNKKIKELPNRGERIVTNTLHNEGAKFIKRGIDRLLPKSGREWKGKKMPASRNPRAVMMRDRESGNLNVVVGTTNNYHYLYFPDDGTNTRTHIGEQHFMMCGAENEVENIIDACIANLTKEIEQ